MNTRDAKRLSGVGVAVIAVIGVAVWTQQAWSAKRAHGKKPVPVIQVPATEAVWVKRPDGGESCSPEKAQTLEAGAADLKRAKIEVLESTKKDDGKMHIQMCGAPTGTQNAYKIRRSDLPQVITLGFQEAPTK